MKTNAHHNNILWNNTVGLVVKIVNPVLDHLNVLCVKMVVYFIAVALMSARIKITLIMVIAIDAIQFALHVLNLLFKIAFNVRQD